MPIVGTRRALRHTIPIARAQWTCFDVRTRLRRKGRCARAKWSVRASQSAWTAVPLCSVTIVAFSNHAGAAEDISAQLAVVSCQWFAMPAGDAYRSSTTKIVLPVGSELGSIGFDSSGPFEML